MKFDVIKNVLINSIPVNKSGGKVTLSVGEGLLLALDACKKVNIDKITLDELNKLYLEGVKTDEDKEFIKSLEEILVEKDYIVSSDPKVINDDPTRRYFETNLAYHILQNNAESLSHEKLNEFNKNLKDRFFSLPKVGRKLRANIEQIFKGKMNKISKMNQQIMGTLDMEYTEQYHKFLSHDYYGLSETVCENLYAVASSTFLGVLHTKYDDKLSIDVYSDSIFDMDMGGRGRIVKKDNEQVKTTAKGLMKSTSPLPLYDDLSNPVDSYSAEDEHSPIQRSVDKAKFMIESQWSQLLFSRQTQPWSNGISSTTLAQIRNMIVEKRLGNTYYKDDFQNYMTVFAALMLYNSGGHSFFEIFEVLKLPMCRELIENSPSWEGNQVKNDLMYKWLYEDQKDAYEKALESTQIYMRSLLHKKMLNAEIKRKVKPTNEVENEAEIISSTHQMKAPTIHKAVIKSDIAVFESLLEDKSNINKKNYAGWTALMIASQLGKVEHVRKLLDARADIRVQAKGLSALELAVKNQQFETVKLLLTSDRILVKRNNGGNLKENIPALYLACRQNDTRILEAILAYSANNLTTKDKEEALLTAVKIENFQALEVIIKHLATQEKPINFSEKYKFQLLHKAAKFGSAELISQIIGIDNTCPTTTEYKELLNTATQKGFIEIAEKLLNLFYSKCNYINFQENESLLDLNKLLKLALENHQFNMALFLIVHGADLNSVPTISDAVREFDQYLKNIKYDEFFFLQKYKNLVYARAKNISNAMVEAKENALWLTSLRYIVEFLNSMLPENWKLSYNNKIDIITNVFQLFNKDELENVQQSSNPSSEFLLQPKLEFETTRNHLESVENERYKKKITDDPNQKQIVKQEEKLSNQTSEILATVGNLQSQTKFFSNIEEVLKNDSISTPTKNHKNSPY